MTATPSPRSSGQRVAAVGATLGAGLQVVEADPGLPLRKVGTHVDQDVVEHAHAVGPLAVLRPPERSSITASVTVRERGPGQRPGCGRPRRSRRRRAAGTRSTPGRPQRRGSPRQRRTSQRTQRPARTTMPTTVRTLKLTAAPTSPEVRACTARSDPQPGQNLPGQGEERAGRVVARLVGVDQPDVRRGGEREAGGSERGPQGGQPPGAGGRQRAHRHGLLSCPSRRPPGR